MKILVLSSHTQPSSSGPINHQLYCRRHGYDYLFDATPYPLTSKYDQKLQSIIHNLQTTDWLMWVDHDAYFMNHEIKLESFLDNTSDFIFCNSPIAPSGDWTVLNSGVFFIRNTALAKSLLIEALNTDILKVKDWWNKDKQGLFTNTEQDRLVYQLTVQNLTATKARIVDYTLFNARTYDFVHRADEKFIVHFCGYSDKDSSILLFQNKFALDRFLMPGGDTPRPEFRWSVFYALPKSPLARFFQRSTRRVVSKVKRLLGR